MIPQRFPPGFQSLQSIAGPIPGPAINICLARQGLLRIPCWPYWVSNSKGSLACPFGPSRYLLLTLACQQKLEDLDARGGCTSRNPLHVCPCLTCRGGGGGAWKCREALSNLAGLIRIFILQQFQHLTYLMLNKFSLICTYYILQVNIICCLVII